ncbi:hypothetical protein LEP1GSC016_2355 [Leptospira borgpetersenii serovar Hardjo-bovis str. Sponselee]|uniref:Uncharacterized protein n=1 Tax=Leptospira borgpetersenii serovar Hardjo-bovis str. Sponselee TaxID=1303729 RepID=M6BBF8_LEPBO|nr:hypothetical protein LEP1GSC016_3386 [Leptospira borgpetersenii serovar Hardjo-bovis str. Sponselee]EMJ79168.1 hypothetical protein LEP1GSC016_0944 [Leptospira borgpetersenii serovar Hardjo-bovis str. Sponselee]EMJ84057.1 hypothetical protein LEP1GSC016_1515 [Leptospira borgpetersenii serovar Hardjo-bovis str. Sponselee]EMJ85243.1 hypothetical protein LEP1GSC016_2355 [Leptospira borgpetersenii serovar Hardjo-bovis str. Sponselee]
MFESLNEIFVNSYYKNVTNCKTHKGYIVAACDATGISLPKTKEFVKDFGCVKNQLGNRNRRMPIVRLYLIFIMI